MSGKEDEHEQGRVPEMQPEPQYEVDGKKTDAPFFGELLESEDGNAVADGNAAKVAREILGRSEEKILKYLDAK